MTRFIAILTLALALALITAVNADDAFAQIDPGITGFSDFDDGIEENNLLGLLAMDSGEPFDQVGISENLRSLIRSLQLAVVTESEGGGSGLYSPDTVDGLIAIIAFAATEVGIMDPDDCPNLGDKLFVWGDKLQLSTAVMDPADCPSLGGQEGEDLVDLWFELVDAGYTEDEAFDLIELVIGDHNALGFEGESVNTLTSYEGKLPIAEPLPVNNTQRGYISNIRSKKRTHWIEPHGHILW